MQHIPSFCTLIKSLVLWSHRHVHIWHRDFSAGSPFSKENLNSLRQHVFKFFEEKRCYVFLFQFSVGFPIWSYNLSTNIPLQIFFCNIPLKGQILKLWLLQHKLVLVRNVLQGKLMLIGLILLKGYSGLSWNNFGECIGSNSQCTLASSQCVY